MPMCGPLAMSPPIADVGGVAGVADDHAVKVDPFLGEELLLLEPAPRCAGMRRDRHAGLAVRLRDRAQNPLDSPRDAGFVRRALENCRLDARVRDALGDVADEHVRRAVSGPFSSVPGPVKWKNIGTSL